MASGRILKTQISLSEQVNDLSIHSALLFTWMIPHADDFGRMSGSARKIKALVVPMRDDFTSVKVDECLTEISTAQLIERYSVNGEVFIQFPSWETHQSGLHKRTQSKFPEPELGNGVPGNSRKFPEIPPEEKRTEENRTELLHSSECNAHAKKKRSQKTSLPKNFEISAEVRAWYYAKGFQENIELHYESFIDKCSAKGYQYANWDAALRNAITSDWAGLRNKKNGVSHGINASGGISKKSLCELADEAVQRVDARIAREQSTIEIVRPGNL